MTRKDRYIYVPNFGEIPEYSMELVYNILGVEAMIDEKWHFSMSDLMPAPPAPVPVASAPPMRAPATFIPTHVFRKFVESAVREKDECPITMDPLTYESVGCPPCGHLFNKDALKESLQQSGCCPSCRSPASPDAIQSY